MTKAGKLHNSFYLYFKKPTLKLKLHLLILILNHLVILLLNFHTPFNSGKQLF